MMSFKKRFQQYFISILLIATLFVSSASNSFSQSKTTYVSKVVLQGWWWNYWNSNYRYNWCSYLTELAPRLKALGFDAVWVPPFVKAGSGGDVGYGPFDPYDLGDKYQKGGGDGIRDSTRSGTKDDLLRMIAVMHANGIQVIFDAVLNQDTNPGSNTGAGGQDPFAYANYNDSTAGVSGTKGYKNFRYVCYKTPLLDDSQNDYWTRIGRWSKNYENFHPNPANFCITGNICSAWFGPDIDYETPGAFGQSSNIPSTGSVTINGITRPYYNPQQYSNYMSTNVTSWMEWLKRQTGIDGYRFDAVKHFPIATQQAVVTAVKYSLPSWSAGGQNMFCIGEWVGAASDVDGYVNSVTLSGGEQAVGAFDFSLRGYGTNGGIYSMVLGQGSYNMQYLQYDQQTLKWMDYGTTRVYRTSPFVNSHDTYRPILDSVGNFSKALGDATGWDTGNELGGNGQHIDPREPRAAMAYAAIMSFDGNPIVFFEDIFNIASNGQRWTHIPTDTVGLPVRPDVQNIIQAHQKLQFKWGDLRYPTNYTGSSAPYYLSGNSGDHFVVERVGKAIIGLSDAYSSVSNNTADQMVWVNVDPSWIGKVLYDYSGAHGLQGDTVYSSSRVLIQTSPCGHTIPGAHGHGYSIWAPSPNGTTPPKSVQDMYNYIATYTPTTPALTTQEWEMANDLGDSHCLGLGQGGALPDSATNERVAGRVYADSATNVAITLTPSVDGRNITASLYDSYGTILGTVSGVATAAAPLTTSITTSKVGWVVAKVRNSNNTTLGQNCYVRVAYTAPAVVNTKSPQALIPTNVSIWTGNKTSTDVSDCGNWEGGKVPNSTSNVIVYGWATPFPVLNYNLTVNKVNLYSGAQFTVNPGIKLTLLSK